MSLDERSWQKPRDWLTRKRCVTLISHSNALFLEVISVSQIENKPLNFGTSNVTIISNDSVIILQSSGK